MGEEEEASQSIDLTRSKGQGGSVSYSDVVIESATKKRIPKSKVGGKRCVCVCVCVCVCERERYDTRMYKYKEVQTHSLITISSLSVNEMVRDYIRFAATSIHTHTHTQIHTHGFTPLPTGPVISKTNSKSMNSSAEEDMDAFS